MQGRLSLCIFEKYPQVCFAVFEENLSSNLVAVGKVASIAEPGDDVFVLV